MLRLKNKGFSLIELLVAVGLLAVVTGGILGMFITATSITSVSYRSTLASFTAQLQMEELIGLTEEELRNKLSDGETREYNGFPVKVDIDFYYGGHDNLAEATVTVFDKDGVSSIYSLTNVINITAGGY